MSLAGKWMDLENIILSEVFQTQNDMHGTYSLISEYQTKITEHTENFAQNTRRLTS